MMACQLVAEHHKTKGNQAELWKNVATQNLCSANICPFEFVNTYCVFHVTLPNQEIDLIHYKSSNAHIFISSLRICLKLKTWSILCIYLMSVPLLRSYTTFPGLSFLLPDFEGFESSNSSQMCKSS